jgi:hypothetical protein
LDQIINHFGNIEEELFNLNSKYSTLEYDMKKYAKKVMKQADDIENTNRYEQASPEKAEKYDDADLVEDDHHAIKTFSPSRSKRNYFGY